jgi:hypothetical protein
VRSAQYLKSEGATAKAANEPPIEIRAKTPATMRGRYRPSQLFCIGAIAGTNLRGGAPLRCRPRFSDWPQRSIRSSNEERRGAAWIVANPIKSSTRQNSQSHYAVAKVPTILTTAGECSNTDGYRPHLGSFRRFRAPKIYKMRLALWKAISRQACYSIWSELVDELERATNSTSTSCFVEPRDRIIEFVLATRTVAVHMEMTCSKTVCGHLNSWPEPSWSS